MISDLDRIVLRLGERMARAEVVLFTGAGFSLGVTDQSGDPMPQVAALRDEIWELMWPGEEVDPGSTLADTYAAALSEGRDRLVALMRRRLTVAPESVTRAHCVWLSMPWRRAYTVNIDDLEWAAGRACDLPRRIRPHSALAGQPPLETGSELVYIHLNGTLDDVPDVTFTEPQYGGRQGRENPFYEQLAAELLSYPVIFVGTQLRESLLRQYVTLRDERGSRGVREMRPESYLVAPHVSRDRRRLLRDYNVTWIEATAAEFAEQVLDRLEDAANHGHEVLERAIGGSRGAVKLPRAVDLAALPQPPGSEYLLGARPTWEDIRSGRAVQRVFERTIPHHMPAGSLMITGTAGAGTSTTLMRLCLELAAEGRDVRWIGADHDLDVGDLGKHLRRVEDDLVVVIDDADTFGRRLDGLLADADAAAGNILLVLGLRSSRVDQVLPDWRPDGKRSVEITVPLLEDSDSERLIAALDRDDELGVLKPLSESDRIERVRGEYGRELLVAMMAATSGERFETKVAEEYTGLAPEQRLIYAIVAIATDLRHHLRKDEILMAAGDLSDTALDALERLVARRLLDAPTGRHRVRHRRIAELVAARLRGGSELFAPYRGLLRAMATRYSPAQFRSRETRLLTALINHRRVGDSFAVSDARALYQEIEALCRDDHHYWLQRGSFEVECGNLSLARTWLAQARLGEGRRTSV